MSTCKVALSLLACAALSERPAVRSFKRTLRAVPRRWTRDGGAAHNSEGRSRATPPALTLSPTAAAVITSLTEEWREPGCRMALGLQQPSGSTVAEWSQEEHRRRARQRGGLAARLSETHESPIYIFSPN